jgi:hypothetical protein
MHKRCYASHISGYENYGGRGITICDSWNFEKHGITTATEQFVSWARDNGYDNSLSIDRIDNDGNYEPSNCRWVTQDIQSKNTRRNRKYNYMGRMLCLSDIARCMGVNYQTLKNRLDRGWSNDKAFCMENK